MLEDNGFLPKSLGNGIKHGLSEADRAEYYAPFPDARSRRPMLQWTRSLPIDGEPADIMTIVTRNVANLDSTGVAVLNPWQGQWHRSVFKPEPPHDAT